MMSLDIYMLKLYTYIVDFTYQIQVASVKFSYCQIFYTCIFYIIFILFRFVRSHALGSFVGTSVVPFFCLHFQMHEMIEICYT